MKRRCRSEINKKNNSRLYWLKLSYCRITYFYHDMSHEETFEKVSDYINAELDASLRDYEFITKLNKTTSTTFKDYQLVAEKIAKNVNKINENQKARQRLDVLIKAIDEIDLKVNSLEALAYRIDSYSKRLEETFKRLESESTERS